MKIGTTDINLSISLPIYLPQPLVAYISISEFVTGCVPPCGEPNTKLIPASPPPDNPKIDCPDEEAAPLLPEGNTQGV